MLRNALQTYRFGGREDNTAGDGSGWPLSRGPHELIEDQVERSPDDPALTMGAEQISYRDLNSRSNRLAHFLREQGVGAETLVRCIPRSLV